MLCHKINLCILLAAIAVQPAAGNDLTSEAPDVIQSEIDLLREEINTYRDEQASFNLDEARVQHIRAMALDVLNDAESRTSLRDAMSSPKWNTIQSADGNFSLNLSMYAQIDWAMNETRTGGTEWGMEIRRLRLTFSGNVIDPSWKYFVRLMLNTDGTGTDQAAYITKDFGDGWEMQMGLLFGLFCLEQDISNTQELGCGLSFISGQWDPGSVNGLLVNNTQEHTRFWATLSNGFQQTYSKPLDNNRLGMMFRGEYKPFGNWDDLNCFNPHPDIDPGIMLGFGASYDWGDYNDPSNGTQTTGPATRLTADFTWQVPGFSIMTCGYYQDWSEGGENWASPNPQNGGTRWGAVGQVTGFLTPQWQLYGRGEWGTIVEADQSDLKVFTFGASYYPNDTPEIKISAEMIQTWGSSRNWSIDGDTGFLNTGEDQTIFRTQVQVSF